MNVVKRVRNLLRWQRLDAEIEEELQALDSVWICVMRFGN